MSTYEPEKFTGCSVASPTLIYVWPVRIEFDAIAADEHVHEWYRDRTETLLRKDGQEWERRCHSKSMKAGDVTIIFQVFDARPVEAERAEVPA